MKRTPLKPGAKSVGRGSTFAADPKPLKRVNGSARRRAISPASPRQRQVVAGRGCLVCASTPVDPAHVWPRGRGGCDHPECVVPLCRLCHREYDEGRLDLLPHLIGGGFAPQLCHALEHARGDLIGLAHQVTGVRWAPDCPMSAVR